MNSVGKQYVHALMIKLGITILGLVFLAIITIFIALALIFECHIPFWQVVAITLGPWVTALCIGGAVWLHCNKELKKESDGLTLVAEMAATTLVSYAANFLKAHLNNDKTKMQDD